VTVRPGHGGCCFVLGAVHVCAVGSAVASPRLARAADGPGSTQALPCRPTIACTADITVPGAVEVEAGYIARRLSGEVRQTSTPFLAKLTVTSWLQFQLGSNGYTSQRGLEAWRFVDSVSAGAKLHLVDQGPLRPAVSVSFAASAPVDSATGASSADDVMMTVYVTKDVGRVHADLNAGLTRWGVNATPASQEWAALALSTALPPPLGVMLEGYYFTDCGTFASRDGGLLFALSHSPTPWLVFDVGGDAGFFPTARSFSAFFGMTVVPVLLWRDG